MPMCFGCVGCDQPVQFLRRACACVVNVSWIVLTPPDTMVPAVAARRFIQNRPKCPAPAGALLPTRATIPNAPRARRATSNHQRAASASRGASHPTIVGQATRATAAAVRPARPLRTRPLPPPTRPVNASRGAPRRTRVFRASALAVRRARPIRRLRRFSPPSLAVPTRS